MTSSHLRVALLCLTFIGILAVTGDSARAIPRFSLISGTRCSACHLNPQGGGLRTELGWDAMNETGAWRWPWQPRTASDDEASEEDLFNAPSDGSAPADDPLDETPADEAPVEDEATSEETLGDDASSEFVDDFDAAEPLPAHEPIDVADDAASMHAPDDASSSSSISVDASPGSPITSNAPSGNAPSSNGPSRGAPSGNASSNNAPSDEAPSNNTPPDEASYSASADEATGTETSASAPVEHHSNSMFDGLITPGFDLRLQLTKIGRPPKERRIVIPMQSQFNVAVTPVDWLALYGGINLSAINFSDSITRRRYPGQSAIEATLQLHPGVTLPTVRIGYMQPSIGIRHDDHTMFTRRDVAGSSPRNLVPPGYAEFGIEAHYEGLSWLTVNAGVFGSSNLAEIESSIGTVESHADFSKPSMLARVMVWPQDLDLGFNGELGASYFGNGDYSMINVFGGIGFSDRGSFLVEGVLINYPIDAATRGERKARNVSVMGSYHLFEWLALNWRYEWGQSENIINDGDGTNDELAHAQQAVFGLEFFPFPNVELRPEYRFFQNEPFGQFNGYLQGQYTLQLHMYY